MTTISLKMDPKMHRYIVNPSGEMLGRLAKEHSSIRVNVPPSDDTNTRIGTLSRPKEKVAAVKESITAHFQDTEVQICEAARRRLANRFIVVSMEVDP